MNRCREISHVDISINRTFEHGDGLLDHLQRLGLRQNHLGLGHLELPEHLVRRVVGIHRRHNPADTYKVSVWSF